MTYQKYQHIQKFGNTEVNGINQGTCYIFYKIDGTNGCVFGKEGNLELGFGSRNRELSDNSAEFDNQRFVALMKSPEYQSVYNDLLRLIQENPDFIVYGEWLIPSTLKTYKDDAWRHFYVFDILNTKTGEYISYDTYKEWFDTKYKNIKYIPLLAKLENPTEEELKACLNKTGDWLVTTGLGEGIVIKNYNYTNNYRHRIWAKMLTEDYLGIKKDNRTHNKELKESDNKTEYEIINMMTLEHILKEKNKVMELHNTTTWEDKFIAETINRTYNEFIHDNIEIIVLKKFKGKTINFGVLKKMSDNKVRKALGY